MEVTRTGIVLKPNSARVLYRAFETGDDQASLRILARVLSLSEEEVTTTLDQVMREFHPRHQKLHDHFLRRYAQIRYLMPTDQPLTEKRRLLIGAYFTLEYSLEAAALFNPSMVPHPDQSGLPQGWVRFVVSLRATGEGHISSIVFRSGTISQDGAIAIDPASRFVTTPEAIPHTSYEKALFLRKIQELGMANSVVDTIMDILPDNFTIEQMVQEISFLRRHTRHRNTEFDSTASRLINLARSNYEVFYTPDQPLSERVIFPTAPNETRGIEDARFVRFTEDDGNVTYIATYTAFDGRVTIPQLLETEDFLHFSISTLNGPEVQNKGMALFPRRVNGRYAMLSRQDGENNFIMYSDDLHFWHQKEPLIRPSFPWEFVKVGNCGSPIETDAGWLVISHGVGAMRKYSIGAFLLDINNPAKVIARLSRPLLSPDETEREGYVPNVVYTCGAMVHAGLLILPYAMSDTASSFASVPLKDLINAMDPVHE
ncbi:MAG: glycoside hydrolase family 130 protein [Candidatus Methylacidiphilales bacterium]|nr:glycoside hydrolase family 130 protein [Candidatus Methylacidiphilales bacterium]